MITRGNPCPVKGCTAYAKPNQLMCWPHWRRVPKPLNHAVFDTYRNLRGDPAAYRQARDAAIAAVEAKEETKGSAMPKVYVACKFRPEDSRSYTYEWEGEPLQKGDIVKVADRSGDGWKRVTVDTITDVAPSFACKPILGLYNPDVEPDAAPEEPAAKAASDPLDDDKILF